MLLQVLLGSLVLLPQSAWTWASPAPPAVTGAPSDKDVVVDASKEAPTRVFWGEATSIVLPETRVTMAIEVSLGEVLKERFINMTLDAAYEDADARPQAQQVEVQKKWKWEVSRFPTPHLACSSGASFAITISLTAHRFQSTLLQLNKLL